MCSCRRRLTPKISPHSPSSPQSTWEKGGRGEGDRQLGREEGSRVSFRILGKGEGKSGFKKS